MAILETYGRVGAGGRWGGAPGHPGNCSLAGCSECHSPAWAPAVLAGVARSQVAAEKKGLLGQEERKAPSRMAANTETRVSICTPATSWRACVAWGGRRLALKSGATETKQKASRKPAFCPSLWWPPSLRMWKRQFASSLLS